MSIFKTLIVAVVATYILSAGGKGVEKAVVEPLSIIPERPLYYYSGLKVGTLGVGVDFSIPLSQSFFVRFNVNGLKINIDTTRESVNYDSDLELLTAGAMVDFYPFTDGEFHISAGAYYYANNIKSHGTPALGNYNIGGTVYTSAELGSVDVTLDFPKFAPYIGLGYGGREMDRGWSWSIDVGVMYHGEGDLNMNVNRGTITNPRYTQILLDAETERQNMEDELREIPVYPVIMVGLTYSF